MMRGLNRTRPLIAPIVALRSFMVALLYSIGVGPAHAQLAADKALWEKCPEGYYSGPQSGRKRYMKDPYTWFVSREFAKRFCMPEEFIDDTLKGALAIAVRIRPEEEEHCGLLAGRTDICSAEKALLLDVYVDNKKANIPKFDPEVRWYIRKTFNSIRAFDGPSPGGKRTEMHRLGTYQWPPGMRPPFSPYLAPGVSRKDWTKFLYVGVRTGWASAAGHFIEQAYMADWAEDIDLITLTGLGSGYLRDPDLPLAHEKDPDFDDPVKRYAIAIAKGRDSPGSSRNEDWKKKRYPEDYLHTIEFPHKLAQMIYAYDKKNWNEFFGKAQQALGVKPTPAGDTTGSAPANR